MANDKPTHEPPGQLQSDLSAFNPEEQKDLEVPRKVEVSGGKLPLDVNVDFDPKVKELIKAGIPIELQSPGSRPDTELDETWAAIDKTKVNFAEFKSVIDAIMDGDPDRFPAGFNGASLLLNSQAYNLLKFATETFARLKLGFPDDQTRLPSVTDTSYLPPGVLPYYQMVLDQLGVQQGAITQRSNPGAAAGPESFLRPRLKGNRSELIWSYWHEEGRLTQTLQAIALRFQNVKAREVDPLANLELDSLRPLANVLFGYIQDRYNRLTIERRNYEYQQQYGISLFGSSTANGLPAVSRTGFIEAFHNLLYRCILFYHQLDDLTIKADPFPVLNGLREVNLLLTEGMHNQYNDLSLRARVEMMMEQWILSRPEIREFLRGKAMVLYKEPWMGVVDTMKAIQGWPSTSIKFYNELAEYGEDILLSIRFIPWSQIDEPDDAKAWAIQFRKAIQRYVYSYQAVTGADIGADTPGMSRGKYEMPGILLQQRFNRERMLKRR